MGGEQERIIVFLSNYHQSELILVVRINLEFKERKFGGVNFSAY